MLPLPRGQTVERHAHDSDLALGRELIGKHAEEQGRPAARLDEPECSPQRGNVPPFGIMVCVALSSIFWFVLGAIIF